MRFAVIGDLHYEASEEAVYQMSRRQILKQAPELLISLGDLGGYSHPGTQKSFDEARAYFESFEKPTFVLAGNHDLEAVEEFSTDADSLAAFCQTFGYAEPYYSFDIGTALGICLSSTAFRDNKNFKHEVHLDAAQIKWLRRTLEEHSTRTTFIFCHCPPFGSKLRVLKNLHLRFANAWVNHSDGPTQFIDLLKEHSQVRLWFSGHNHLGQQYSDSLSHVGHCLFVHTGVIGNISRDGLHQTRIVDVEKKRIKLRTLDHDNVGLDLDAVFDLEQNTLERRVTPRPDENTNTLPPPPFGALPVALQHEHSIFCRCGDVLVEYDGRYEGAIGIVAPISDSDQLQMEGEQLVINSGWLKKQRFKPNTDGYYFRSLAGK